MMEFEINMSEMPLGKLSKQNIQKGTSQDLLIFQNSTEIQMCLWTLAIEVLYDAWLEKLTFLFYP